MQLYEFSPKAKYMQYSSCQQLQITVLNTDAVQGWIDVYIYIEKKEIRNLRIRIMNL